MNKKRRIAWIALIMAAMFVITLVNTGSVSNAAGIPDIHKVVASSNIDSIPFGGGLRFPSFNVTEGSPAVFNTNYGNGSWEKLEEGEWVRKPYLEPMNLNTSENLFTPGTWRYAVQVRIDHDHYYLAEDVQVIVNGEEWEKEEGTYMHGEGYSCVYLHSKTYYVTEEDINHYFTINLDPGAGSGTMEPLKVIKGQTMTLPLECTFTPPEEGYYFAGWRVGSEVYDPEDYYYLVPEGDSTIYATWANDEHRLDIELTLPSQGEEYDYSTYVTPYTFNSYAYEIKDINWYGRYGIVDFNKFKLGMTYLVSIEIVRKDETTPPTDIPIYINGKRAAVMPVNVKTIAASTYFMLGWPFADIDEEAPGAEYVREAYEDGIISGYSEDPETGLVTFKPNKNVTRAQFAIMLFKLAAAEGNIDVEEYFDEFSDEKFNKFTDVSSDNINAFVAINWASECGIISGFGNNKFKPNNYITRAQISSMLMKYAYLYDDNYMTTDQEFNDQIEDILRSDYADYDTVQEAFRYPVYWMLKWGLMSGKTKNGSTYIDPNGYATRMQCAIFLERYKMNTEAVG